MKYFYKIGIGGILGVMLAIIGIYASSWKFYIVIIPVLIFEQLKEDYLKNK